MLRLRGLVVDDSARNMVTLKSRFKRRLAGYDLDIVWDERETVDAAVELIEAQDPYHIVISDILFVREDLGTEEPNYDAISSARKRSPATFVFAISGGEIHQPNLLARARQAGANHACRRDEFNDENEDHSPYRVAAEIAEFLILRGRIPTARVSTVPAGDPSAEAVLEQVGRPIVSELYRELLGLDVWPAGAEVDVSYIAPGISGARVLVASTKATGRRRRWDVVKLMRDHDALAKEVQATSDAATVLPQRLTVPTGDKVCGPLEGWYAINLPMLRASTTLRSWLRRPDAASTVEAIFDALFTDTDALTDLYEDTMAPTGGPALDAIRLSTYRRMLVGDRLSLVCESAVHGGLTVSENVLRDFLDYGQVNDVRSEVLKDFGWTCSAHGDLHGGNVLVYTQKTPTPALIDETEFGTHFWTDDIARLFVDLALRCLVKPLNAMFWDCANAWREAINELSRGNRVPADDAFVPGGLEACEWLGTRIMNLAGTKGPAAADRWQIHASIASYLLRAVYQADLPSPAIAVAVAAAQDQLVIAADHVRAATRR